MVKVCFVTEENFCGQIKEGHINKSVLLCFIQGLNALHIPYCLLVKDLSVLANFDYSFFIIPKNNPGLSSLIPLAKRYTNITVIQEGPSNHFHDWDVQYQSMYLKALNVCDNVWVSNKHDLKYYKSLTKAKVIHVNTTIDVEATQKSFKEFSERTEGVISSSTLCNWYNGLSNVFVAKNNGLPIIIPGLGRIRDEELYATEIYEGIKIEEFRRHDEWVEYMSGFKYAVNMTNAVAGGNFPLICACLGIPCIGTEELDTQSVCFPKLSVDRYNISKASKLLSSLKKNHKLYKAVSDYSIIQSWDFDYKKICRGLLDDING